jgi:TonB family protein
MDLPIENVIEENVDSVAKELGIDSTDMKLETKAMDSLAKCEFGSDIEMGDVDFVEYNMGEVVEMGMVIDTDWVLDPPPPPPHFDTSFLEGDNNKVYGFAEKMPEFPGGNDSLVSFVRGNLNYPDVLKESGESGRVYVQFVVNQVGVISEVNIVRNFTTHPEVEEEVKRIIASMPLWKAGEINGKKVSVRYTLPLNFKS